MQVRPTLTALTTVVAGLLALPGAASAQSNERPWSIGLTQDFTHQSNLFGSTAGSEVAGTVSTTTLDGGVNTTLGRQRLYATAALSHVKYKGLSDLDSSGYSLGAGLDWETVERLSGSFTANSQKRQADFNVGGITPLQVANLERTDEVNLRARLGVVTLLGFEAGIGHRRVTFSAAEYESRQYNQDSGNVGLTYRPSSILSLSSGFSTAETRNLEAAPGQSAPERNKRRDFYVSANWAPTGASTVDARLAASKQTYDQATAADFKGATGSMAWNWRPSGRLTLTTILSRDSGQNSGFLKLQSGSPTTATDFSQVTNRIGVSGQYELTGKIVVTGAVSSARRDLVDGVTGLTGQDTTNTTSLGARWAATRIVNLGCNVSRDSRSASGVGSTPYDNNRYGCFGSVTLN
jgi:hypothetical protein